MKKIYIGIDPDTDKSGFAIWNPETKNLELFCLPFFKIFETLKAKKTLNHLIVIVDAGWLNKKNNFRQKYLCKKTNTYKDYTLGTKEKMSVDTGANHQTGKLIIEMCKFLGVEVKEHKPVKSKIDHETFVKITGYTGRTNQEKRDAGMLVFGK